MREMRRIRRRDGAQRWTLLQDIDDLSRWTERFQAPTWLDYLRQRQRLTMADREVALNVDAFHRDEASPKVRHLLERTPTVASNRKSEAEQISERASRVDPYLPPIVMPDGRDARLKAEQLAGSASATTQSPAPTSAPGLASAPASASTSTPGSAPGPASTSAPGPATPLSQDNYQA